MVKGIVAVRKNKNFWIGVRSLYDSIPLKLGKSIFIYLYPFDKDTMQEFVNNIEKNSEWWYSYPNNNFCKYCEKFNNGYPANVAAELTYNKKDKELKLHQHKKLKNIMPTKMTKQDIRKYDWLYVLDGNKMKIYTHSFDKVEFSDAIEDGGKLPGIKYKLVESIILDEKTEPNWDDIQRKGEDVQDIPW